MEKDYKIETNHGIWWVCLSRGNYSDYTEKNFFIAANNAEEAWFLFKKYLDTDKEFEDYSVKYEKNIWQGEKFDDNFWGGWDCVINPLDIIHFLK